MEAAAEKLVLEISLGDLYAGEQTVGAYLVGRAAALLLERERDAGGELRRRVQAIADETIREQLRPVVAEALDAAVQRTDAFGAARGSPTTLRELVIETARQELGVKKDRGYGKPRQTLVEQFVSEEVERALRREMQAAVQEAKVQVMVAVREQAAQVITETIERVAAGRTL